jgi:DNA-binding SARP family transcriptional activator/cytochrome c-type biogenesis protein CcmH/NrfG
MAAIFPRKRMSMELRMLGALTVLQDGKALELPVSRKARVLLAYLAMAPRGVHRDRLSALLFEDVGDPRAELRWCLSKLRGVMGARIRSLEQSVTLELTGCVVDAHEIQQACHADIEALAPARARELLAHFRGAFLDELQLEGCPQLTAWLLTQRRSFQAAHVALLQRLADGSADGESLGYVEKWLELAPLDVRAHEKLLAALARAGRFREGVQHLSVAQRLFDSEGLDALPLARAWRAATTRTTRVVVTGSNGGTDVYSHEFCAQGRRQLARMMKRGLDTSRDLFVRAVELDPGYGPAWAGLATVNAWLFEWFGADKLRKASADQTSRRALELAPDLAEAHVARGLARSLSRHYDESAGEFEQALRIDPYSFDAHYFYARTAFARGDMKRAAELFQLAADARPEDFQSPILLGTVARALGRERDERDAVRVGVRRAEQALARDPDDGRALSMGAGALLEDGQVDRALEWSRRVLELYPDDTSALVNVACTYARAGQVGDSLDLLERVFAQGCGKRDWVENDPDYLVMRQEPRFHRLLGMLS